MDKSNAPAVLARFAHELEAEMLVNQLRDHGIEAQAVGATVSGFRAEAPGEVEVLVRAEQWEEAKQLLASEAFAEVDWSKVDVGDVVADDEVVDAARSNGILNIAVWAGLILTLALFLGYLIRVVLT